MPPKSGRRPLKQQMSQNVETYCCNSRKGILPTSPTSRDQGARGSRARIAEEQRASMGATPREGSRRVEVARNVTDPIRRDFLKASAALAAAGATGGIG